MNSALNGTDARRGARIGGDPAGPRAPCPSLVPGRARLRQRRREAGGGYRDIEALDLLCSGILRGSRPSLHAPHAAPTATVAAPERQSSVPADKYSPDSNVAYHPLTNAPMALSAPLQVLITRIYSVGRGQERAKLSVSMATANKDEAESYTLLVLKENQFREESLLLLGCIELLREELYPDSPDMATDQAGDRGFGPAQYARLRRTVEQGGYLALSYDQTCVLYHWLVGKALERMTAARGEAMRGGVGVASGSVASESGGAGQARGRPAGSGSSQRAAGVEETPFGFVVTRQPRRQSAVSESQAAEASRKAPWLSEGHDSLEATLRQGSAGDQVSGWKARRRIAQVARAKSLAVRIPDNAYGIRPWLDSLHGSEVHNLTRELFHYRGQAQQRGKGAGSERAWLPWYDGTPEDYAGDGEWAVMPEVRQVSRGEGPVDRPADKSNMREMADGLDEWDMLGQGVLTTGRSGGQAGASVTGASRGSAAERGAAGRASVQDMASSVETNTSPSSSSPSTKAASQGQRVTLSGAALDAALVADGELATASAHLSKLCRPVEAHLDQQIASGSVAEWQGEHRAVCLRAVLEWARWSPEAEGVREGARVFKTLNRQAIFPERRSFLGGPSVTTVIQIAGHALPQLYADVLQGRPFKKTQSEASGRWFRVDPLPSRHAEDGAFKWSDDYLRRHLPFVVSQRVKMERIDRYTLQVGLADAPASETDGAAGGDSTDSGDTGSNSVASNGGVTTSGRGMSHDGNMSDRSHMSNGSHSHTSDRGVSVTLGPSLPGESPWQRPLLFAGSTFHISGENANDVRLLVQALKAYVTDRRGRGPLPHDRKWWRKHPRHWVGCAEAAPPIGEEQSGIWLRQAAGLVPESDVREGQGQGRTVGQHAVAVVLGNACSPGDSSQAPANITVLQGVTDSQLWNMVMAVDLLLADTAVLPRVFAGPPPPPERRGALHEALVALQSLPARFAKATAPASVLAGLAALAWAGPSTLNFLGARAALSQPPPVARMLGAAQGMPSVRVANSNLTSADAQRLCALVRRHIGDVHLPPESVSKARGKPEDLLRGPLAHRGNRGGNSASEAGTEVVSYQVLASLDGAVLGIRPLDPPSLRVQPLLRADAAIHGARFYRRHAEHLARHVDPRMDLYHRAARAAKGSIGATAGAAGAGAAAGPNAASGAAASPSGASENKNSNDESAEGRRAAKEAVADLKRRAAVKGVPRPMPWERLSGVRGARPAEVVALRVGIERNCGVNLDTGLLEPSTVHVRLWEDADSVRLWTGAGDGSARAA